MKKVNLLLTVLLLLGFCLSAGAESYTYNTEGTAAASPDAYTADLDIAGESLGVGRLSGPTDIKISPSGRLAVSDTGNGRVILTDPLFREASVLQAFDRDGEPDALAEPTGLFFTEDEHLYVCDQKNQRIVEFDEQMHYVRSIQDPTPELLPEGFAFYPSAVAVDKWGTVYCISYSSTNGYLQFSAQGEFKGFMGSPEVTLSISQKFWRALQSKEQRKRTENSIPVNFNNLAVDEEGFVYTTEINPNKEDTAAYIQSGTKSGLFMPIKKFNFNGDDVLPRLGAFAPAGDIDFEKSYPEGEKASGQLWASHPVSITLGENGTYFVADTSRNKIFGYDSDGNLLYAFAGTGSQKGLFSSLTAIEWHDGCLYALDKNHSTITRFTLTEYGMMLHEAIGLSAHRRFEEAEESFRTLLSYNQNLTVAYIELGRACLEQNQYEEAMEYFRIARDMEDYTTAFSRWRETLLHDWFLVIPAAVVLILVGVAFAVRKMNAYNLAAPVGCRRLHGHLLYAQHVVFHPFDGFWDIGHEQRGSAGAAAIFLVLAAICVAFQNRLSGFAISGGKNPNPFLTAGVILIAALVFCVANWCLTSLANGKGRFRDIFIVTGYSAVPLIVFSIPITILSNLLTSREAGIVTLFVYLAYLWTAFLLFTGIMTVQQYSLGWNVLSLLLTLLGMLIIVFLAFLLFNLIGRIAGFFSSIITEINLR